MSNVQRGNIFIDPICLFYNSTAKSSYQDGCHSKSYGDRTSGGKKD